jgi:DNA-binding NarL/FixJ family response regulator
MTPKTRLVLLDDHALFRVMLSKLLDTESGFHVVADCSAIDEALTTLARQQVDLVLLDYDLGQRITGFQFIERARKTGYTGRIFIVTAGMNDADYVRALAHGICGIFLKHSSPELLIKAIHTVMAGETWIDKRCVQSLVDAVDGDERPKSRSRLSERERGVLREVFAGLTNKEIGVRLGISEAAVKSALQQLFVKTGVRTRSQLVRVALEDYGPEWGV